MFVVSANYRNRQDPKRWLLRGADDKPNTAKAFTSVVATNVKFTQSDYESGFGCSVVAQAETAVGSDDAADAMRENEVKLTFWGAGFETLDEKAVDSCASLRLTPDGSMYAVLNAAESKSEEKTEERAQA